MIDVIRLVPLSVAELNEVRWFNYRVGLVKMADEGTAYGTVYFRTTFWLTLEWLKKLMEELAIPGSNSLN
jgi:hypothetical protein